MKALLLRHPAIRRLPFWMLITFFAAQAVFGIAAGVAALGFTNWRVLLLGGCWLVLTEHLQLGQVRRRASIFDLGLPLSPRRLWIGSLLGAYLGALGVLASITLLLGGAWWLFTSLGTVLTYSIRDVAILFVLNAAALLPATVWAHGRRPELATAPRGWRHFLHVWLLNFPVGGLMLLMRDAPAMFLPIVLVLFAALLAGSLRRIPAAFSTAPSELAAPGKSRRPGVVRPRPMGTWRLNWNVYVLAYRTAPKGVALLLVAMPLLLLFGWVLGGALDSYGSDFEMGLLFLPMTIYMLTSSTAPLLQNLKPFDALPLSRRRLYTLFCLPVLVFLAVGYTVGATWFTVRAESAPRVVYAEEERAWGIRVPRDMWRLSLDGNVPAQVAPDGEAHAPMALKVLPGLPMRLWKPYSTPAEASRSYVEWQAARALSDLHGVDVRPADLAGRYFRTDEAGRTRLLEGPVALGDGLALPQPTQGRGHAPVVFMASFAGFFLCLAWFAPRIRAGSSKLRRNLFLWTPLGILLGIHLGQFLMPLFAGIGLWVIETAARSLADRLLDAVPGGLWGAWALCLLVSWAAFELSLKAFQRTESPVDSRSCFWDTVVRDD